MGSSLRARLAAMGPRREPPAPAKGGGLKCSVQTHPLPGGLDDPSPVALKRMGLDRAWPGAEQLLFLDTETTGLAGGAGTVAFMVGAAYAREGQLVLEQYTLGDYGDEPAMMDRLADLLASHLLVITFNGRAFDMPLIRSRFTMLRMDDRWPEPGQLDLLPPARRLWKKRLGTVKLSVLEDKILRAGREDDLPGSEAPARFFQYLKTGDERLLDLVAKHNRLDVLAMPKLLLALIAHYAGPGPDWAAEDLFSLGRTLERQGDRGEAVRCYHMASLPRAVTTVAGLKQRRVAGEAMYAMGLIYKRLGEYQRAAAAFEQVASRGQMGHLPMAELAKHYEHRARDYEAALGWTECALAVAERESDRAALNARRARLRKKIDRGGKRHGT